MSEIYGKDETEFSGKLLCTTAKSSVYKRLGPCQKINRSVRWTKFKFLMESIQTLLDDVDSVLNVETWCFRKLKHL